MATIPLSLYLWKRLHEVGVGTIMGVPGDFNLQLLDQIYNVEGLQWVGNANELNAAYAADGYARVKNGPGCFITTHGVGELSALNAVAGSMTEQVKIVHVVGQTTRSMQAKKKMIHHSIGFNPNHHVFSEASRGFRVDAAELRDKETAPAEIDRVIRECFLKSGPVYIFFPLDMADEEVPASLLETPIDLSLKGDATAQQATSDAVDAIIEALTKAKNPAVLVDCLVQRHNAVAELNDLVNKLRFPTYATNMGKALVDEDHPNYVGIYNGFVSNPGVAEAFRSSDLAVVLGSLPCDTNTGGFDRQITPEKSIDIAPFAVTVKGKLYSDVYIKNVLGLLIERLNENDLPKVDLPTIPSPRLANGIADKAITQEWIWDRIAQFLQPHDVILGETGTAAFGLPDATFPKSINWITQTYYGSIGYATPAALGTELALEELSKTKGTPRGRTVLVTGDGSLQLTAQEIGTMIAQGTRPVILVINNAGYTIERVIHGAKQGYNDVSAWNFSHTLQLFGMSDEDAKKSFFRAATKTQLNEILEKEEVSNPKNAILVEIVMEKMDAPWRLIEAVAARGPETVKKMKEAGFRLRGTTLAN